MERHLSRESVHWNASEVAEYLESQCITNPNPQYAPALSDVWNHILQPFFADSANDLDSVRHHTDRTVVWAPIGRQNTFFIKIQGICSAIAYVLSTTLRPLPMRKYRMILAVFTQFCRLVPSGLRPDRVHVLWLTGDASLYPPSSQDDHPIVLVDDHIYVRDETHRARGYAPSSSSPGYLKRTLHDLFRTVGPRAAGIVKPTCECSKFIPSAWYLNDGRPVTSVTALYVDILDRLKLYKSSKIRFADMRDAARRVCSDCNDLMSTIQFDYNDLALSNLNDSPRPSDATDDFMPTTQSSSSSPHSSHSSRRRKSDSTPSYATAPLPAQPSAYNHLTYSPPELQFGAGLPFHPSISAHSHTTYAAAPGAVAHANLYTVGVTTRPSPYPVPPPAPMGANYGSGVPPAAYALARTPTSANGVDSLDYFSSGSGPGYAAAPGAYIPVAAYNTARVLY